MTDFSVFVYTEGDQPQTTILLGQLITLQASYPHKLVTIDINDEPEVYLGYRGKTPVLETGIYHLYAPISSQDLEVTIKSAHNRHQKLLEGDQAYGKKLESARTVSRMDVFSKWIVNHYMLVLNLFLFLYVGLPFLAPVLQKANLQTGADIIYKIYSPLCHQLAYRSWFLFGEQPAYPRELAHIHFWDTYEEATGNNSSDVLEAKRYRGNESLGYKVAYCERDVAIYGGILLFGIIFSITGRKLKAIPWYIWLILGLLPVGIDGASQMPALLSLKIPLLPLRESTPLLRTITGLLFGVTTAWYGLPLIEDTMRDSKRILNKKFALDAQK